MNTKLVIDGEEKVIELDESLLAVSEVNMNDFLMKFAASYSFYNNLWTQAQFLAFLVEDEYDALYHERFKHYKETEGGSDKLSEARVKSDPQVIEKLKSSREAKYASQQLYSFLRAMDKAHESALNLGYNLRKEMGMTGNAHILQSRRSELEENEEKLAKLFEEIPK